MKLADRPDGYFFGQRLRVAVWSPEDCTPELSWMINTNIPCATFTIMEDGEPFCRGIVIDKGAIVNIPIISSKEWSAAKAVLKDIEDNELRAALVSAAIARA